MTTARAYWLGFRVGLLKRAQPEDPFSPETRKHFQMYLGQQPEQMEIEQQTGLMLLARRRRVDQMARMLKDLYAPMPSSQGGA